MLPIAAGKIPGRPRRLDIEVIFGGRTRGTGPASQIPSHYFCGASAIIAGQKSATGMPIAMKDPKYYCGRCLYFQAHGARSYAGYCVLADAPHALTTDPVRSMLAEACSRYVDRRSRPWFAADHE